MIRYVFQAFEILGLHRLLCKFDSQPLFLHLVQNTDCLFRCPCLVRVDSDGNVRSCRLADCRKTFHIQRRIHAHLDFQAVIPPLYRLPGVLCHLLRIVDADRQVCADLPPASPQKLVNRDMVQLSVQVPQRHVHSRLGALVPHNAGIQASHQVFKFVHISAQKSRPDVFLNGSPHRTSGVSCYHPGGGRFAVSHAACVRVDLHNHIVYMRHCSERRLKRRSERH